MPHISYLVVPSACALVFRIPELVVCLGTFLTHHDLAQLTLTSRQLRSATIPLLWNRLDLLSDDHPQRLLGSADALKALARNVRHIRSLAADTIFFSYYLDAFTLYLDLQPISFGTNTGATPVTGSPLPSSPLFPGPGYMLSSASSSSMLSASSIASAASSISSTPTFLSRTSSLGRPTFKRPQWLSSTVLDATSVIPLPPLSHLTRVNCSLEMDIRHRQFFSSNSTSSSLSSSSTLTSSSSNNMDHRGTALSTPQVCWLISLSTRLTHLCFHGVELEIEIVVRVLCRTITQLHRLKHLELSPRHNQEISIQVCRAIFLSCPPLLESLIYSNLDIGDRAGVHVVEMDLLSSQGNEWAQGALVLREEPLEHLKRLVLPGMRLGYKTEAIDWVVEQCPALEAFDVPCFADASVGDAVSSLLRERCPHIRHLSVRRPYLGYRGGGAMSCMEKIPEQRLETFYFKGYIDEWPLQFELALSRHTETLREIRFVLCRKMNSSTIKTILTSCLALVHLEIQGTHLSTIHLALEDAIESEWVCCDLENLHIAIDVGQHEDPSSSSSSSLSSPHIRKPPERPMTLTLGEETSEDDLIYWESLETLYRTIGSLSRLTVLNLKVLAYDSRGKELDYTSTILPGLLTLGDSAHHQPGFLPLLSSLTHLRELRGAVRADTPESMATMGQKEVEWMVEHWPSLDLVEFLPTGHENKVTSSEEEEMIPPHLRWLQKHRPGIRLSLRAETPSFAATF
ncbi:hypothetical protein BGZ89_000155 [Linnemannia elongata]|nr:hypothetical protein BGZ89_000155 [Linnemannia elongata]